MSHSSTSQSVNGRFAGRPSPAFVLLVAALACSGAYLLVLQSHFTFFADDWSFLLDRQGTSVGDFLNPHNDHIALAPVAIYKALIELFGIDSLMPFAVVSTLVFLLAATLLFVYLRRRVGDWIALLATTLILFLGAGWSDLLWSFQIGFTGSVAAGIGALLALEREDRKGDLVACALLICSTSFSELGVPFAVGAFVAIALGPPSRVHRLYVPLLPIFLYGLWYLGWGHTAPRQTSLENLVDSPKFVMDSVAENLSSLFGVAPLFSDAENESLGGLAWGYVILGIGLVSAAWGWRRGWRPSRWLWVVVATGGAFWFLTALNAIPGLREPTSGRYQYPGAILVLLIAGEALRGARAGRLALMATGTVVTAAAVSGAFFLHEGYEVRRGTSEDLRARLTAVEIGRAYEDPNLLIAFHIFVQRPASSYFSVIDEFGSPAFSEAELRRADPGIRAAVDQELTVAEGIRLVPAEAGAGRLAGNCRVAGGGVASAGTGTPLEPGTFLLQARRLPGVSSQLGVGLQAARFGDGPSADIGVLKAGAGSQITIPLDGSKRPWRLYAPQATSVSICDLR